MECFNRIFSKEPLLPEYDEVYRSFLKDERDNKTMEEHKRARKMKVVKTYGMDTVELEKIEQEARLKSTLYSFIAGDKKCYEDLLARGPEKADEIIEKYAILSFLVSNKERLYMMAGQNPLEFIIFNDLVSAAYPSKGDVFQAFNRHIA